MSDSPPNKRRGRVVAALLAAGVGWCDLGWGAAAAVGFAYAPVVWVAVLSRVRGDPLRFAALSAALILAGWLLAPGGAGAWREGLDRLLTIAVVVSTAALGEWVLALLAHESGRVEQLARQATEERERRAEDRRRRRAMASVLEDVRLGQEKAARVASRLDLALTNANVGLWDWDLVTGEHYLSPTYRTQLGFGPTDPLFESFERWVELVHPKDRDAVLAEFEDYLAGRSERYGPTFRLRGRDGKHRWITALGRAVFDPEGRPTRVTGVHIDVTETRRLIERLRVSNEELDRFTQIASHDLKAPLRSVTLLSEWLTEDLGEDLPEESAKHLEKIRQRAKRMERLLDDLLTYASTGRTKGARGPIDLDLIVREVTDLLALPEGFRVETDLGVARLEGFRTPLETVIRNLINNAVKHHDRPAGRIVVASRETDLGTRITVSDDGPGIPPELRSQALEIFRTLRPRDEVEGSGLGLALVKKIVEGEGGRVGLEDNTPRGLRVVFDWPHAEADPLDGEEPAGFALLEEPGG